MKKIALVLAMALLIPIVALPARAAESGTVTLLVYMCGSDLESDGGAAASDLYEMMSAGIEPGGNINLIVLTGGCSEWTLSDISNDECELWQVSDSMEYIDSMGDMNMGDGETLAQFLKYGIENHPANRYGLVLWDHGGGASGGLCYDENYEDEMMLDEFTGAITGAQEAYAGGDKLFDFITFDACLMSTFEVIYNLRDTADYIIASEELVSGCGMDYTGWLSELSGDTDIDTLELGKVMCDTYMDAALEIEPDDMLTMSITDTRMLDLLADAVEDVGGTLTSMLNGGELNKISRMRTGVRACGDAFDASSDMVDINALADALSDIDSEKADVLRKAVSDAIVYNRYTDNIEYACGMSLLMPYDTVEYANYYMPSYDEGQLLPKYSGFVAEYINALENGSYSFGQLTPSEAYSSQNGVSDSWQSHLDDYESTEESAGGLLGWGNSDFEGYFGEDGGAAYAVTLDTEQLENLAYVEAMLYMDISDEDMDAMIELGFVQDVDVDWDTGDVVGLFDGSWPTLEGQMVAMYDQSVTGASVRSLIDVTVNGEETYLLVVFNDDNPYGKVVGYTSGYDENGNPVRGYTKLAEGDLIVPQYTMYYWPDEDAEEPESTRFAGDEIVYDGELEFGYNYVEEDASYLYGFCFNDIYGDYEFSDYISIDY